MAVNPIHASTPVITCNEKPITLQRYALALVNQARSEARRCGFKKFAATKALTLSPQLSEAALSHANDMALHNFFSHTGSNLSDVAKRATVAGYSWQTVAENIAAGQKDMHEAIQGWLDSPSHCRNIMNPSFTQMSLSCAANSHSEFKQYWVQVLGSEFQ